MKRFALLITFAAPAMAALAQSLPLDPVGGPNWWVHPPGPTTRLQYHSFLTHPSLNLPPDYTDNGFTPSIPDTWVVNHAPTSVGGQNPLYGDGDGYLIGPNDPLTKDMGNLFQPTWVKEWFVQLVWTDMSPQPSGLPVLTVTAPGAILGDGPGINTVAVPGTTGVHWWVTTWRGTIQPQPEFEKFDFVFPTATGAPVVVDSLWIGTTCVPEPAGLAALAVGLGGAAIRRRRAR